MPVAGSLEERGFAELIHLVGIDVVPCKQHPYDPLVPVAGSLEERGFAEVIHLVGVDVVPCKQHPYDPLVPVAGSLEERGFADVIYLVGLTSSRASNILTIPSRPLRAAWKSVFSPN